MRTIKRIIFDVIIIVLCVTSAGFICQANQVKDTVHEIAELARSIGLPEDDPIIARARELWWSADDEFCRDRDIIATVVYNEAWGGCSDRHRELVAAVVCNRVASKSFPDTVEKVVCQKNQYHPAYAEADSFYGRRARANEKAWVECQRIAARALLGEVEVEPNVLYQAEFRQGTGVYETHATTYSTTYFCFG